jgi:threonine dehydratase
VTFAITRDAVVSTYARIREHVRRTPVIEVAGGDFGLDAVLTLKLEYMQHAGSFKARGAFATMLRQPMPRAGVAAASGGNHGAAVAFAARQLGVPAKIFVPEVVAPSKAARIRELGAELVVSGARYDDARKACDEHLAESGALGVHAYDAEDTLLGQATLALELEQQAAVDTLLVAVGGGGLIGGIAGLYAGKVKVVAVEPEGAPTLHLALAAGAPVDAPSGSIAADSLAPRRVGTLMLPIAQRWVSSSLLVSDDAIADAQRLLWKNLRIVTEPAGATAFAALTSKVYVPAKGERVGIVLCGANTSSLPAEP